MKQAVKSCKVAAESIAKTLRAHSMAMDPEFSIVAETLLRFLKTAFPLPQLSSTDSSEIHSLLMRLLDLTTHYQASLDLLQKDTQSFLRHLQSARLHHPLSIRSMFIFQTLRSLSDAISSYNRNRGNDSPVTTHIDINPATLIQSALTPCGFDIGLDDPVAHSFWLRNWPDDDYIVPWLQFQTALMSEFPNTSLKALTSLQYLLDFSATSTVSKTRLNTLLKLVPSFSEMVGFAAGLLSKPWFLGYLGKDEATLLLQQEPVNTFIVRLHKAHRGTLVCSYSSSNRGVQHHVIQLDKSGYSMLNCEGSYPTLDQLIAHTSFLQHEYSHLWMRSSHFLGEASKEDAEQLLFGLNDGVYVVRLQPTPSALHASATLAAPNVLASSTGAQLATPSSSSSTGPISPSSTPSPPPPSAHSPSPAPSSHKPLVHQAQATVQSSTPHCWRESCYFASVNSSAGNVKHFLIPCDLVGNVIVGGKSYADLSQYLEQHKSIFSMPFAPSLPRFRARLDTTVGSSSPTISTSHMHNSRFARSIGSSSSSGSATNPIFVTAVAANAPSLISLSSSVGIPRFISSGEPFHLNTTPTVSQDDVSVLQRSSIRFSHHDSSVSSPSSPSPEEDLPIIDIDSLSLCLPPGTVLPTVSSPVVTKRKPWKALSPEQLNPLGLTYRDMWAELLRFYHISVPEAKIPPKTHH